MNPLEEARTRTQNFLDEYTSKHKGNRFGEEYVYIIRRGEESFELRVADLYLLAEASRK